MSTSKCVYLGELIGVAIAMRIAVAIILGCDLHGWLCFFIGAVLGLAGSLVGGLIAHALHKGGMRPC